LYLQGEGLRMGGRVVARLTGFVATVALVVAAAWWVGTLTGLPGGPVPSVAGDRHAGEQATGTPFAVESAGLVSTAAGYTLVPRASTTFEPGEPAELAFVVTGSDGLPVTAFDVRDERLLDLFVVRRDGAGYQHLRADIHPDGVWRAPLTLPAAGVYRMYADFVPTGGPPLVLGIDLQAPGDFAPATFPPSRAAHVAGYDVRLDADLVAGGTSRVFVTIDRSRVPVTDIEPHLGALGHLVVLRESDLAYLRVAPQAPEPDAPATHRAGPAPAFTVEVPAAGEHRLFLEFRHEGVVHTAEFTVRTGSNQ
jgi:hypothetical protein